MPLHSSCLLFDAIYLLLVFQFFLHTVFFCPHILNKQLLRLVFHISNSEVLFHGKINNALKLGRLAEEVPFFFGYAILFDVLEYWNDFLDASLKFFKRAVVNHLSLYQVFLLFYKFVLRLQIQVFRPIPLSA